MIDDSENRGNTNSDELNDAPDSNSDGKVPVIENGPVDSQDKDSSDSAKEDEVKVIEPESDNLNPDEHESEPDIESENKGKIAETDDDSIDKDVQG